MGGRFAADEISIDKNFFLTNTCAHKKLHIYCLANKIPIANGKLSRHTDDRAPEAVETQDRRKVAERALPGLKNPGPGHGYPAGSNGGTATAMGCMIVVVGDT